MGLGVTGAIAAEAGIPETRSSLAETGTIVAQLPDAVSSDVPVSNLAEMQAAAEEIAVPGMDQVTSVSQLTDVKPTDWAFQALQSLVERYGCIVGYPDRTFRGNRALTRYEFAAGLNACMDRINELIAAATADLVRKEDLLAVQKLQEEFAAELAVMRGRIDALEVRTATLEKQQFSTTTKLNGLVWANLTGAFTGDDIRFEALPAANGRIPDASPGGGVRLAGRNLDGTPVVLRTDSAEPTLSFLTWLTLSTSFTGKDLLITQLAAGNGISPANQFASAGFFNSFGAPFTDQGGGPINGRSDVVIHDLFYSFPLNDAIKVTVGPRINWYRHFDFNRFTFFLTGASSFDSIGSTQTNSIDRGSGVVVEWNISPQFRFAAAYLGENTEFLPASIPGLNTSSNPAFGLFGGTNTTTAELTYSPNSNINIRLGYNYSRVQAVFGQVGGATAEPIPYGQLDDGFSGGGLDHATAHTFTANFDWLITPGFGVFGRYGYGTINLEPVDGRVRSQSFQVGLGFPDLGKKGALGVLTFLMPMDIIAGRRFFVAGAGDGGTMYELEASYFYPLSSNIAIVPAFYAIFNANNFDSNPTLFVGNLRAQFSF
jgi:hypothetical protein